MEISTNMSEVTQNINRISILSKRQNILKLISKTKFTLFSSKVIQLKYNDIEKLKK